MHSCSEHEMLVRESLFPYDPFLFRFFFFSAVPKGTEKTTTESIFERKKA